MPAAESGCYAVRRGEARNRLDPHFHAPKFADLVKKIRQQPYMPLGEIVEQSTEMWNQKIPPEQDCQQFRYLEISAVGLETNTYSLELVPIEMAPSRARMVLKAGDIVVSTTRPHRGAIAHIRDKDDGAIASTGFAVLRRQLNPDVRRDFLLEVMLSTCVLTQLLQRSSGGAYPAITPDELDKVIVPVPSPRTQGRLVALLDTARTTRQKKLVEADDMLAGLDSFVLDALGLVLPKVDKYRSTYAVRIKDVRSAQTIYPDYFHPERMSAIRAVQSRYDGDRATKLLAIADFIRDQKIVYPNDDYLGLANVQSNTGERIASTEEDSKGNCFKYRKSDVLFARLRPYLNKVYRAESDGVCSTEFHVIRIRPDEKGRPSLIPDYLAAVLRSSIVLAQTKHMMTGNTHPRLANDNVVNLVVPVPDRKVQENIADEVSYRCKNARQLRDEAARIWDEAKRQFEEELLGPKSGGQAQ